MSEGFKFITGLVAGFLLMGSVTFGAFYLNLGVPSEPSRWAFEVIQKKRQLAAEAAVPKLLLVGGSATLFGINAREMEKKTGKRTINLGCHAALGVAFILYEAQKVAKPGDSVLLAFEYELYNYGKLDREWADVLLLDYLVARAPDYYLHHLSLLEQWNVFMFTSTRRINQGLKRRNGTEPSHYEDPVYSARNVNDWGDQIHHSPAERPADRSNVVGPRSTLAWKFSEKHKDAFAEIEAFKRWAQTNHIHVLATYPNLCDQPAYHTPFAAMVDKNIREFFTRINVPVVGTYTDALLPADQFFDTYYHLTEEAALERTRKLAIELLPLLD